MRKHKISLKEKLLLKIRKNPKKAVKCFIVLLLSLGWFVGYLMGVLMWYPRRKAAVTASADGGYALGTPVNTFLTFQGNRYALLARWSVRSRYTYEISLLGSVDRSVGFGGNYLCQINYVENYAPGNVVFNLASKANTTSGTIPSNVSVGFESIGAQSLPSNQKQSVAVTGTFTFNRDVIALVASVTSLEHHIVLRVNWNAVYYPCSVYYSNPPFQSLAGNYSPKELPELETLVTTFPNFLLTDTGLLYSQQDYNNAIAEASKTARSEGYQAGYSAGHNAGGENNFLSLLTAVVDAPVKVFTSLLDVEILGFNMKNVMLSVLSAALIVSIFRLFSSLGNGGS